MNMLRKKILSFYKMFQESKKIKGVDATFLNYELMN